MDIRFSDKRCLTPQLLEADGRPGARIEGVIEGVIESTGRAPDVPTRRFVDAVDYDGLVCRYRIARTREESSPPADGAGTGHGLARAGEERVAPAEGSIDAARWIDEDDTIVFRSFARLVVERLRTFGRDHAPALHRFPGAPPGRELRRRLQRLAAPYTLTVLDTCVTLDGRLWARAALRSDTAAGWRARHRAADHHVEGWLPLADARAVADERGADGPVPGRAGRGKATARPIDPLTGSRSRPRVAA